MNKNLAGLVAVAAVVSMATTSIPASAKAINLDEIRSVIENALNDFTLNNYTTDKEVEHSYANVISEYDGVSTDAQIWREQDATTTTPGAATIHISINTATTPSAAEFGIPKEVTTTSALIVQDRVNDTLKKLSLNNDSNGWNVSNPVREALNWEFNVSVHGFTITPAVDTTTGSAVGTIVIYNNDNDSDEFNNTVFNKIDFNLPVSKVTDNNNDDDEHDEKYASLDKAKMDIRKALHNLNISNSITSDDIQKCVNSVITNKNITAVVNDFYINDVTDTKVGYMKCHIVLTDSENELKDDMTYSKDIDTAATAKIKASVHNYFDSITPSNSMTEKAILAGINNAINDPSIKFNIDDFYLMKSVSGNPGYCDFYVELKDSYDNHFYVDYSSDDFTSTEETSNSGNSGSTGNSGSSSSSSSSHHSSSSSSSSSSSTGSTSTAATGTANSSTGTLTDSTKPVSLTNMSKEAVKAVEAKVISSIGTITGATAGQAKEVETTDGAKLSVTPIAKDGKSVGAVITAEAASAKAVIPVEKDQAPVTAVYKYVPLLDKYIQVQNAVITVDAITLPVQANATYVASPAAMPEIATIKQGWVQVNNNWYMVNATGDPLTGWQKDSVGWTYMSTSTGAMQTGWAQVNGAWYYLKNNGYMATGWVSDGNAWYYCNADGSMAYNTVIDGYTLGANGSWIG